MVKLPDPFQNLSSDTQELVDQLTRKRGKLQGVYRTLLLHPELAERVALLGDFVRFEGVLTSRQKEVLILATARELGARFVWQQHEPVALQAGMSQQSIEALRARCALDDRVDNTFAEFARNVARGEPLAEQRFEDVKRITSLEGCVEAATICGFYHMITCLITSFEVPLPRPEDLSF